MSLDERLKEMKILVSFGDCKITHTSLRDDNIAQIKQAFIDEHWVEVERPGLLSEFFVTRKGKQIMITGCVITTKDDGRALEIRGATGEDARVPQPETTEPEIVINKYEGHKVMKEYEVTLQTTLPSLRDGRYKTYTNTFTLNQLTEKDVMVQHINRDHNIRVTVKEVAKHYAEPEDKSDMWPDTSPNAKDRVTEL